MKRVGRKLPPCGPLPDEHHRHIHCVALLSITRVCTAAVEDVENREEDSYSEEEEEEDEEDEEKDNKNENQELRGGW